MKRSPLAPVLAALVTSALACGGSGSSSSGTGPGGGGAGLQLTRGAITERAAGSITVNGTRIDTRSATVHIEKAQRPESELEKGMVVTVKGTFDDRTGTAAEVEFEDVAKGRVDDKGTDFLVVGGQTVRVDDSTEFPDGSRMAGVSGGSRVRISGVPDDRGGLRATRVDHDDATGEDLELKGFVSDLSAAGFTLKISPDAAQAWTVTLAPGVALPAGIANGSYVEVRSAGAPQGGAIVAAAVSLEDRGEGEATEVEIEGIVSSGTSSDFVVDGQAVHTTATTRWYLGAPTDLAPGVKVEVEGHALVAGVLQAEKVSFRAAYRLQGAAADVAISGAAGTLSLLGIPVSVSDLTEWRISPSALAAGTTIEVRGVPRSGGAGLVATRIEATNDTRLVLQGVVSSADAAAGSLGILGLTAASDASTEFHAETAADAPLDRAAFFAAITPGVTVVKVRGRDATALSGTTLTAKEMELESQK
ncbi:DUF5666 domain-containing protein [Anaeromyxobacter oryzae]|uniref:DUF5666 domain-containing protein n=1 Tax=Anaeromyxobacter oryzae TaxID=2918170 RepID=A0ABM7WZ62_9BACT|nr:DUF5666 domain-containing protein [Anaeromyxobacter oryzae]BDG04835.1 hypothetical protein AMOR_38310 [Anaeromyxobacter oryzae]